MAKSFNEYYENVPEDRKEVMTKLRKTIMENMPKGIEEQISYGYPGFVVPHSIYPKGYHCDPKEPVPFVGISSRKNYISFYAFCIYSNQELIDWFTSEYPKHCKSKLDMGKGCIRFKKMDDIPYELLGELMRKITLEKFIEHYEAGLPKK